MEKKIVEMVDEDNNSFYIETEVNDSTLQLVANQDAEILKAIHTLENSFDPVINLSKSFIKKINSLKVGKPSELELKFAVKLSGKLDFWIVSADGEGSIDVKLKWTLE